MEFDSRSNPLFQKAKAALNRTASTFELNKFKELDPGQVLIFDRMARVLNSFVTILDPRTLQYLHVSSNSKEILGYPATVWLEGGLGKHFTLLHKEELEAVINFHDMGMSMLKITHPDQRLEFRMNMDMRIRHKSGEYRKFVKSMTPLQIDSEGNILAWLNSYQDITPLKKDKSISFIVREGDMQTRIYSYSLLTKEVERVQPLTRREKEVLRGLSQGLDTRKIAENLSITATAVGNHRRKLIEKTSACNTDSMVSYLNMIGLLDSPDI